MTDHKGLPVAGYQSQSDEKVQLVNEFKAAEERLLRKLDEMAKPAGSVSFDSDEPMKPYWTHDQRWVAIARTHFQEGFMALNRAVFQPQRIRLPEDE